MAGLHLPLFLYSFLSISTGVRGDFCSQLLCSTRLMFLFYSSPATKLLFTFLWFPSSGPLLCPLPLPLTFVLLFLFCFFASLSSSQLMTANTQMVSLHLSLWRLSLVSVSNFLFGQPLIVHSASVSCAAVGGCCSHADCQRLCSGPCSCVQV